MKIVLILVAILVSNGVVFCQNTYETKQVFVHEKSDEIHRGWFYKFGSTEEFVDTLSQSNFSVLASGKTHELFYAVLRSKNTLYLTAWSFLGMPFESGGGVIRAATDKNIVMGGKPLALVQITVYGPMRNGESTQKSSVGLLGLGSTIDPTYRGKIEIHYKFYLKNPPEGPSLDTAVAWN